MITLEDDTIVIRLTADAIAHAFKIGMWAENRAGCPETPPEVTDKSVFLREVYSELTKEQENGDTPVHRMVDKAMRDAWEYGCEGLAIDTAPTPIPSTERS